MTDQSNEIQTPQPPARTPEVANPTPDPVPRCEAFLHDAQLAGEILSLAATGATDQEIADYFDLPVAVIHREYAAQLKRGRATLHMHLRKKQLQTAMLEEGDVRLLQFLGKYYLGQNDSADAPVDAQPVKTYQNVRIEDV